MHNYAGARCRRALKMSQRAAEIDMPVGVAGTFYFCSDKLHLPQHYLFILLFHLVLLFLGAIY